MNIEVIKQNRGDYAAEIDLAKEFPSITGGTLYAYGDTPERAKANLFHTIQDVVETFLSHIHGE